MEMNNKKLTFLKYFSCALIVVVFAIVLFINYARYNMVYAANVSNFNYGGLSASYDKGTWTASSNTIIGEVNTKKSSGCLGDSYTVTTGTLTIKNNNPYKVSINYSLSITSGGGSISNTNSSPVILDSSASFNFSVTSKADVEDTTKVLFVVNSIEQIREISVTCNSSPYGKVFFDGDEVSSGSITKTKVSSETFKFKFVLTDNTKKLLGFFLNDTTYALADLIADNQEIEVYLQDTCTIRPIVCNNTDPIFSVESNHFIDLNEANSFAVNHTNKTIILYSSGTISGGSYLIDSTVRLLIPYDSNYVFSTSNPDTLANDWSQPSVYKKLTLENGSKINCNGSVCVNSKIAAMGQNKGHNGTPSGPHGTIEIKDESKITFNSGASFYCWGYTIGSGTVEMKNGSIIYECFQIRDWPGGSNALNLEGNSQKVFLFSQYYIQNVEAHLLFNQGAKEYCYTCVYMARQLVDTIVQIIGSTSDKTLFRISEGKIDKFFDPQKDTLQISIYGNATISSIKVTMKVSGIGADIDSANYVLPLNGNIHIIVKNGGIFSTNQNFGMLPGSKITVENGGVFNVNNSIYLYDINSWAYNDGEKNHYFVFSEVKYTALDYFGDSYYKDGFKINTRNKNACIDINGTVSVSGNGKLYTTNMVDGSYADVISSEKTGSIRLNGENSTQVYQFFAGSTSNKVEIPCIQVKLKNGDSSYYDGDVTKIITYNALLDVWGDGGIITATIRFVYGSTTKDYQYSSNEPFVFPNFDIFGETQYSIKRWITSDWNHNFLINESTDDLVLQQGDILVFNPFFGGFITLLNNNDWYYVDYFAEDGNTFVKGLYRTRTLSGDSIKIHYFSEETGELLSVSNDSDIGLIEWNNNLYYLDNNGYVKEFLGLVEYLNNYYYFGEENKAYRDGVYFIETNNETYPSGFYRFDEEGHLVGKITHGLVETSNGDLYYIDSTNDSSVDLDNINPASSYVVTNSTIYVIDFDLSVSQSNKKVGLYYFGEDGKMISYKEVA